MSNSPFASIECSDWWLIPARILLVRWLPVDVARTWGCHWLEHVLSPKSHLPIPKFPPSGYLSSPLASVLSLARYPIHPCRFSNGKESRALAMQAPIDLCCCLF